MIYAAPATCDIRTATILHSGRIAIRQNRSCRRSKYSQSSRFQGDIVMCREDRHRHHSVTSDSCLCRESETE